jgi:hypothetical protein
MIHIIQMEMLNVAVLMPLRKPSVMIAIQFVYMHHMRFMEKHKSRVTHRPHARGLELSMSTIRHSNVLNIYIYIYESAITNIVLSIQRCASQESPLGYFVLAALCHICIGHEFDDLVATHANTYKQP